MRRSPYRLRLPDSSAGYSGALDFHPLLDTRVTTMGDASPFPNLLDVGVEVLDKAQSKADKLERAIKVLLLMGGINTGLLLYLLYKSRKK